MCGNRGIYVINSFHLLQSTNSNFNGEQVYMYMVGCYIRACASQFMIFYTSVRG